MSKSIMHDLKTERTDLAPPLPAILMVLPVLFYAAAAGSIGLGALFTLKAKQAQADEHREMDSEQEVNRMITSLAQEQKVIDETNTRAREVETWVDSTQPLMDVVVAVINSVKTGNTLSSMRLARSSERPDHIEMRLQINSGGTVQKEETVQSLVKSGYQTFRDDLIGDKTQKTFPRAAHPVIRTHPVTGRQAIFVNPVFTVRIEDIPEAESKAILEFLYEHCARPHWQVRFRWQADSVAFWDNRCVQHIAMWDYFPQVRSGFRVTVKGDKPIHRAA